MFVTMFVLRTAAFFSESLFDFNVGSDACLSFKGVFVGHGHGRCCI